MQADIANPSGTHVAEPGWPQSFEVLFVDRRRPVNRDQAHPALHQFVHRIAMRAIEQQFRCWGRVNDNRTDSFQNRLVFRPNRRKRLPARPCVA